LCNAYCPKVLLSHALSLNQPHALLDVRSSLSKVFDCAASGNSFTLAESLTALFYVKYRSSSTKVLPPKGGGIGPGTLNMKFDGMSDDEILAILKDAADRTDETGNCNLGHGVYAVPCPECRGAGFIRYSRPIPFSLSTPIEKLSHQEERRDCELCHGLGYREMAVDP
jgi:hypothetical protein